MVNDRRLLFGLLVGVGLGTLTAEAAWADAFVPLLLKSELREGFPLPATVAATARATNEPLPTTGEATSAAPTQALPATSSPTAQEPGGTPAESPTALATPTRRLAQGRLYGRWWSRLIAEFGDGEEADGGVFELADPEYLSLCNDCYQAPPITHRWRVRDHPGEVYRWALHRHCKNLDYQRQRSYRTESLGRQHTYTTGPPRGFTFDQTYCWYVFIEDGKNGGRVTSAAPPCMRAGRASGGDAGSAGGARWPDRSATDCSVVLRPPAPAEGPVGLPWSGPVKNRLAFRTDSTFPPP